MQWFLWLCNTLSRSLLFFTRLPSLRFIFDLLVLLHFDLLISSDSLIFLLLYLDSLDNVFGCNQLNWQWHFKQHFVAPKLSNFPLMLSWWCLIVLVITFVSPMYSLLQLWFKRVFIWHCLLIFFSSKQSLEHVTLRVSWGEFRIK